MSTYPRPDEVIADLVNPIHLIPNPAAPKQKAHAGTKHGRGALAKAIADPLLDLYIRQGKTLEEAKKILADEHGIEASDYQYQRLLRNKRAVKKVRGWKLKAICYKDAARLSAGKRSRYRVYGVEVSEKALDERKRQMWKGSGLTQRAFASSLAARSYASNEPDGLRVDPNERESVDQVAHHIEASRRGHFTDNENHQQDTLLFKIGPLSNIGTYGLHKTLLQEADPPDLGGIGAQCQQDTWDTDDVLMGAEELMSGSGVDIWDPHSCVWAPRAWEDDGFMRWMVTGEVDGLEVIDTL